MQPRLRTTDLDYAVNGVHRGVCGIQLASPSNRPCPHTYAIFNDLNLLVGEITDEIHTFLPFESQFPLGCD